MKFFLISAALLAVAVANPLYVNPGIAGPAPVITEYEPIGVGPAPVLIDNYEPISVGPAPVLIDNYEPINVGPAPVLIDNYEPINVGPAIIDETPVVDSYEPINVGPVIIDETPVAEVPASSAPVVQVVININSEAHVIDIPAISELVPEPVIVVEQAELSPVVIPEATLPFPVPGPAIIPTPVLPELVPEPVVILPDVLN